MINNIMFTHIRYNLVVVSIIYLASVSTTFAQKGNEYQVKAAFLYNLARMVEWPSDGLVRANIPVTFCFFGEDFFGDTLDSIKNKTVKNRPLFLKKNVSLMELGQCDLLFISRSESRRLPSILAYVEKLPVLTVGDTNGFAELGGMVNLMTQGSRIQIEVNLRATKEVGLKISSRLLTLADIVEGNS